MKLFTPGPVSMREEVLKIGSEQLPYFRTEEFSEQMLYIKKTVLGFIDCIKGEVIPLAASGTGAMDCAVSNLIGKDDRVLVINNGTFGERWADICDFYQVDYINYRVPFGKAPDLNEIDRILGKEGINVVLTQGTETSSSQSIPLAELGKIVKKHKALFIVDAITAFLIDEYKMDGWGIDATIISSQKGFCVPPGVSFLVLGQHGIQKKSATLSKSYYFNIDGYIKNMKRGQTPFTPPISILHQIREQLMHISSIGLEKYLLSIKEIAEDLRNKFSELPFHIIAEKPSNCLTAYRYDGSNKLFNAFELFRFLIDEYNLYVTPVGGALEKTDVRVAHIGSITYNDNTDLVQAIKSFPNL